MRADGSQAEPWRNGRVGHYDLCSLFLGPFLSSARPPARLSPPSRVFSTYQNEKRVALICLWLNGKSGPGYQAWGIYTGIEMPHGRQGWGLCQDKHCPFKGCRRPSNLGKGPLLSEVQQFRADVSLNVPDPLYCKKGDNSYSCLLFLFVCLFVGWRPWPL